jgi:hypothetical protein
MYFFYFKTLPGKQKLNIIYKNSVVRYILMSKINRDTQITGLSSYYFFLFNQVFFSQLLKVPSALLSFNARDIIPKSLIYYAVHSAKLIR